MNGEICGKADYLEQKAGGCRPPPIRGEQAVTLSNARDYPLEIASIVARGETAPGVLGGTSSDAYTLPLTGTVGTLPRRTALILRLD